MEGEGGQLEIFLPCVAEEGLEIKAEMEAVVLISTPPPHTL